MPVPGGILPRPPPGVLAVACAAIWSTVAPALAHPTGGFVRVRSLVDAVEVRITLPLQCLTELVPLDRNHDARITADELRAAVPALSRRLNELWSATADGADFYLGRVASVTPLWSAKGAPDGVKREDWETRFADLDFHPQSGHPSRAVRIDLSKFFARMPSCASMEILCGSDPAGERILCHAGRPAAALEPPIERDPAPSASGAAQSRAVSGGMVRLVCAVGACAILAWSLVRRRGKAGRASAGER